MNVRSTGLAIAIVSYTAIFTGFVGTLEALAHNGEEAFVMRMYSDRYEPAGLKINQGDVVHFVNESDIERWPASNIHPSHGLYPEFDPQDVVMPGESWEFRFDEAGAWRYHDHIDPRIKGVITVESVSGYQAPETAGGPDGGRVENTAAQNSADVGNWAQRTWMMLVAWWRSIFGAEEAVVEEPGSQDIFSDTEALASYIQVHGIEAAMAELHRLSVEYGSCHDQAHEAGRIAYTRHGADAFQLCSAECHSGCYHGATEAYFHEHGLADMTENLDEICSPLLNEFYSHQCLHGVGHGLMAYTDYEIFDALTSCDQIDGAGGQSSCYSGVFMENIVGGLAGETGHFTEYLSTDPLFPCTIVDEKYRSACYFLQSSRMVQLYGNDFEKISNACLRAPETHQFNCISSMGRDVGAAFRQSPVDMIAACDLVPEGRLRHGCLGGAVQDTFWDPSGQDVAVSFCKLLSNEAEKSYCYTVIMERATQVLGSEEMASGFCQKIEAPFQAECLRLSQS